MVVVIQSTDKYCSKASPNTNTKPHFPLHNQYNIVSFVINEQPTTTFIGPIKDLENHIQKSHCYKWVEIN